jgi:hypothetical protein
MIQPIPPSTTESLEADFYPSLKNPAVALCTEVWQKIHAATLRRSTPPLPHFCRNPTKIKGLAPKNPSPPQKNKELTTSANDQ